MIRNAISLYFVVVLFLFGCSSSAFDRAGVVSCDPEKVDVIRARQCELAWERRQAGRERHLIRLEELAGNNYELNSDLIERREYALVRREQAISNLIEITSSLNRLQTLNEMALRNIDVVDDLSRSLVELDRALTQIQSSELELERSGLCPDNGLSNGAYAVQNAMREGLSIGAGMMTHERIRRALQAMPSRGLFGLLRRIGLGVAELVSNIMDVRSLASMADGVVVASRDGWSACRSGE
ncbi:hypothetical protein ACFELO_07230 [Oceanicaulis sp. LC35]|uniref:hypothetical protein n=1 Tax=Oceanicaulis sp. LC35 TaxID=3349635 RepID=UPI003F83D2AB